MSDKFNIDDMRYSYVGVKKCQVDELRNDFNALYSKYRFLCTVDCYLWDFAFDDFEELSINLFFFLKSLNSDFVDISKKFSTILEKDNKENA